MDDLLATPPGEDAGSATQDRFSWQHHCIAAECIDLVLGGPHRRVICEIHEDYIVERESGPSELVSCKHRESSRGPWKIVELCATGGVGHLFSRWTTLPGTSLRLMTNAGLAAGEAEAAAIATACLRAADGHTFRPGSDMELCRDTLAAALTAAGRRRGFTGIPPPESPIPPGFLARVEQFMGVLRVCADLPDRRFVGAVHAEKLMGPCLAKLGFDVAHASRSYGQLIELVHRKNTASTLRDAYGEHVWGGRAGTASGRLAILVTTRTIAAHEVLRVIQKASPHADGQVTGDLSHVRSFADLARRLDLLRQSRRLTLSEIADRNRQSPLLDRDTLNDALNRHRLPSAAFVQAFLACCDVPAPEQGPWLAAWRRARANHSAPVVVREASPYSLGVRFAEADGDATASPPPYVPRDHDAAVRAAMSTEGCFVVLVGPSCAGKTRTLYEAVRAVAPTWDIVRPFDVDDVHRLAAERPERTVLWLDELQRYLGAHQPLSTAVVNHLVSGGLMVLGTLWTSEYRDHATGGALGLADVMSIKPALSADEYERAATMAAGDTRIAQALTAGDYTFTQMLAGGPAMMHWWAHLSNPYAKATVEAAVDARRLGVQSPLSDALLTEAIHDYLSPLDRLADPTGWLDRAASSMVSPLPGAVAPVIRTESATDTEEACFVVADFLNHHLGELRRSLCPPHSLWSSLVSHLVDPGDIRRVAAGARARMRYRYSPPLLRQLIATGEGPAAVELSDLYLGRHRIDDAIALVKDFIDRFTSDESIQDHLTRLVDLQRKVAALSRSGDLHSLREIYADRGRVETLRSRADRGDPAAQDELAQVLADRGQIEELDRRADAGDPFAGDRRAALHRADRPEPDGGAAIARLRADIEAGEPQAPDLLTLMMMERRLTPLLWEEMDSGTPHAAERLIDALIARRETPTAVLIGLRTYGLNADGSLAYPEKEPPRDIDPA
jgi:hypothetical protein